MTHDRAASFFAGAWAVSAPLLVWALHLAASTLAVTLMCAAAVKAGSGGSEGLRMGLLAGTMLAVAALAALLWSARAKAGSVSFLRVLQCVCIALAMVAVLWTGVPLWMLPACPA